MFSIASVMSRMNDVMDYHDLSFDRAILFTVFLLKFNDQNVQNQGKLLAIINQYIIDLFPAISNFLTH